MSFATDTQVFTSPRRRGWSSASTCVAMADSPACPPPTHATVREYVWDVDHHIDDMPLADLPAAWVDFISRPAAGGSSGKTAVTWRPAPNGSRLVTDGRETCMRDVVWQVTHRLIQRAWQTSVGRRTIPGSRASLCAAGKFLQVRSRTSTNWSRSVVPF